MATKQSVKLIFTVSCDFIAKKKKKPVYEM